VPKDIIQPDKMTRLMVDMSLVDGNLLNITQAPDSLYKYGMGNYLAMFKKHHTDTLNFKRSFTYYTKNPEKLDAIFNNVIKILQAKSDSLSKVKEEKLPPPVKIKNAVPTK